MSFKTTLTEVASILLHFQTNPVQTHEGAQHLKTMFVQLSDEELDSAVSQIKAEHPDVGEVMLNGHLRSRDIYLVSTDMVPVPGRCLIWHQFCAFRQTFCCWC